MTSPPDEIEDLPQVVCVMATFNRKEITLRALHSLWAQEGRDEHFLLRVVIFDDASHDGTPEAVRRGWPQGVHVLVGDGDDYWARSMAKAQLFAMSSLPEYLLWLNDDVELDPGAVIELVRTSRACDAAIAVGAMADPQTGETTYSGTRLRTRRPTSLDIVAPSGDIEDVDSFHGNLVLVPRPAYLKLGTIDPTFAHAYGDNDYGLRAQRVGVRVVLARRHLGSCSGNALDQGWLRQTGSRAQRTRMLFGRKGLPVGSHFRYNVRHARAAGVTYATASYLKALGRIWLPARRR